MFNIFISNNYTPHFPSQGNFTSYLLLFASLAPHIALNIAIEEQLKYDMCEDAEGKIVLALI